MGTGVHRQLFRSLRARNLTAVFVHNIEIKMAAKRARMALDYNQLNSSSVVLMITPTPAQGRRTRTSSKLNA